MTTDDNKEKENTQIHARVRFIRGAYDGNVSFYFVHSNARIDSVCHNNISHSTLANEAFPIISSLILAHTSIVTSSKKIRLEFAVVYETGMLSLRYVWYDHVYYDR